MPEDKKTWRCTSKGCDFEVTTYVKLSTAPIHTHPKTKRSFTMKEVSK